jgi:hypothetical protein
VADIFDQVAGAPPQQQGDIFDQVGADAASPGGLPDPNTAIATAKAVASQIADAASKVAQVAMTSAIQPALDAASSAYKRVAGTTQSLGETLAEPFQNLPLGGLLSSAVKTVGDTAAQIPAAATSPVGAAIGGAAAGASPLLTAPEGQIVAKGATTALMAPGAAASIVQAAKEPTQENIGSAAGQTVAALAPMAPEIVEGAKNAAEAPGNALEAHNARSAELVEQERNQGLQVEGGRKALGGDSIPVKVGDQTYTVEAVGGSGSTTRPAYLIRNQEGKPVFAGYGENAQGYLRMVGARPLDEPAPKEPTYEEAQPTGPVPQPPPEVRTSERAKAAKPEVPETGPSDMVQRVQDARDNLAQQLAGKPFKELTNPERLVIDHFVTQGYGFASAPAQQQGDIFDQAAETKAPAPETKAAKPETKTPPQAAAPQKAPTLANARPQSAPAAGAAPAQATGAPNAPEPAQNGTRAPRVAPAYGNRTDVIIPGEDTRYPVRYAVREAADVQASHNPFSFEPNPNYEHQNDRDYSDPANSARVIEHGKTLEPRVVLADAPTAEQGPPILDTRGNALGGNNRTMAIKRAYAYSPDRAADYRQELTNRAQQFGIDPQEIGRFREPVLVREMAQPTSSPEAQLAITDLNKTSTAQTTPAEQAVKDGQRLTPSTVAELGARIQDTGEHSTLAQVISGEKGADVLQHLVKDGVVTPQEANGYVDERGHLTPEAKDRVAKALVGRLYETPQQFASTPPEMRAKLERVAPQVLRTEGRAGWEIGPVVREAAAALEDARAHNIRNLDDLAKQQTLGGEQRRYSPEAIAVAKKLQESPTRAAAAFRQYANDEAMSRPGAQTPLFEPPTQQEAFAGAFGATPEAYTHGREGDHGVSAPGRVATARRGTEGADAQSALGAGVLPGRALGDAQGVSEDARQPGGSGHRIQAALETRNGGERGGPEAGGVPAGALTLGLDKFLRDDVAPAARETVKTVADGLDDALRTLAPTLRGASGKRMALILRRNLAEMTRSYDRAEAALAQAKRFFASKPRQFNYDFIDQIEHGLGRSNQTGDLAPVAAVMTRLLDQRRDAIRALGTGKLREYYENYFKHVWQDPRRAGDVFTNFFGRRPFEGGKGFLKQRTYPTLKDGLDAGLKPVSDNPVDLVMTAVREMDRYLMAQRSLGEAKESGLAKYIPALGGHGPAGWRKVADPIGTVYGNPEQQVPEYLNKGLLTGLRKVLADLKLDHRRKMRLRGGPGTLGLAYGGTNKLETKFATDEQVLAHEIGHHLEFQYPFVQEMMHHPDPKTRAILKRELRALADLRYETNPAASQYFKDYVRSKDEKAAAVVQAYVAARDRMRQVAPTVLSEFESHIAKTPAAGLKNVRASLESERMDQTVHAGGLVVRGHYWMPEAAATILENHLGPGLSQYGAYRVAVGLNNSLNQFQLGMSALHLTKAALEASISKAALGIEYALRGKPLKAIGPIAEGSALVVSPAKMLFEGSKMTKEWFHPGSQGGAIAAMVDHYAGAGGRARMDEFYRTRAAENMRRAFANGNIWGAAARLPFAAVEMAAKPIMEFLIPRVKMGAFAEGARMDLERLGAQATSEEVEAALAKRLDSVDNRLGQMTYDNQFFDRTAKDVMHLLMRAPGWNIGTVKEVGGGLVDAVREPLRLAGGAKPSELHLGRISYVMAMLMIHVLYSSIYQYLHTGQLPHSAEDAFAPRTGNLNPDGTPERVFLRTYVKDAYEMATHPVTSAENKAAPIWSMASDLLRNQDHARNEIRHPDDSLPRQGGEVLSHVAHAFEPIGVEQSLQQRQNGASGERQAEQFFGITDAPRDLTATPAQRLAAEIAQDQIPAGARTAEQQAAREAERNIARLARSGGDPGPAIRDARARGVLSARQVSETLRYAHDAPIYRETVHLPLEDVLRVWKVANPEERRVLRPLILRRIRAMRSEPARIDALLPQIRDVAAATP